MSDEPMEAGIGDLIIAGVLGLLLGIGVFAALNTSIAVKYELREHSDGTKTWELKEDK